MVILRGAKAGLFPHLVEGLDLLGAQGPAVEADVVHVAREGAVEHGVAEPQVARLAPRSATARPPRVPRSSPSAPSPPDVPPLVWLAPPILPPPHLAFPASLPSFPDPGRSISASPEPSSKPHQATSSGSIGSGGSSWAR